MISGFWFFNFFVPLGIFFAAAVIRSIKEIPQSATTDFIALLIGIDFCVFYNRDEFSHHMPMAGGVDSIANTVYALGVFSAVLWIVCLTWIEPLLDEYNIRKIRYSKDPKFPFVGVGFAWFSNAGLLASHVAFAVGKLNNLWSIS